MIKELLEQSRKDEFKDFKNYCQGYDDVKRNYSQNSKEHELKGEK